MIHETAQVHPEAKLEKNVVVWNWVQIRERAEIGENSVISKGVYIDTGVKIGKNVKIQNNVSVYEGVTIESGVFVGPHVCFTNDKSPRALNPDGHLKANADWKISKTLVKYGSSIGANATILPGVTIGRFAVIGAGAAVTKDVPDYGLAFGNPAKLICYVCECGQRLTTMNQKGGRAFICSKCGKEIQVF